MKTVYFITHLQAHDCDQVGLSQDFKHFVYCLGECTATVPRQEDIMPETIVLICHKLGIPVPNAVLE